MTVTEHLIAAIERDKKGDGDGANVEFREAWIKYNIAHGFDFVALRDALLRLVPLPESRPPIQERARPMRCLPLLIDRLLEHIPTTSATAKDLMRIRRGSTYVAPEDTERLLGYFGEAQRALLIGAETGDIEGDAIERTRAIWNATDDPAPLDGILVPREELEALARYVEKYERIRFDDSFIRVVDPLLNRLPKPEPVPAPCPWCEVKTNLCERNEIHFVGCPNSRCCVEGPCRDTKVDAIEAWNRVAKGGAS